MEKRALSVEDPALKRVHLKTAIQHFAAQYPPPPVLLDLLALPFASSADRAQLAANLAHLPELTRIYARLGSVQAGYRVSWEEAIYRLAPRQLRFYGVRWLLRRTFTAARVAGFDLEKYWDHVETCAHYAECIADRIQSPYRDMAGVAGLLHDLGKPALAALAEQGYGRMLQLSSGIFTLDAERAEFGCDHTLAGKWFAERWGIGDPALQAIWLHHHPTRHLDHAGSPVELIDIIALANILAHLEATEGEPDIQQLSTLAEDRWIRLGLSRADLLELIANDAIHGRDPFEPPAEEIARQADAKQLPPAPRHDAPPAWAAALESAVQNLQHASQSSQVLLAIAGSLRDHFPVDSGLLCLRDGEGNWGAVEWDLEAIRPVDTTELDAPGAPENCLQAFLAANPAGTGTGMVALPIHEARLRIGQLYIFSPAAAARPWGDLLRFLEGSAHLLVHWRRQTAAAAQGEGLAETVWTQELLHHQQLRRAEHTGMGKLSTGLAAILQPALANIMSRAQALLGRSRNPEEARALETILAANHRAMDVMNELLQFVQPSPPQFAPVSAIAILEDVLRPLRPRLRDQGIHITLKIDGELPELNVDAGQIQIALLNVLQNAEAALHSTGGEIALRVRPSNEGQAVRIHIHDTGRGIPAHLLDRVFEPFFSIYGDAGHAGLGLSICKSITDAHRGTIALHSSADGTTCTITLPANIPSAQAPETEPQPAPREANRHAATPAEPYTPATSHTREANRHPATQTEPYTPPTPQPREANRHAATSAEPYTPATSQPREANRHPATPAEPYTSATSQPREANRHAATPAEPYTPATSHTREANRHTATPAEPYTPANSQPRPHPEQRGNETAHTPGQQTNPYTRDRTGRARLLDPFVEYDRLEEESEAAETATPPESAPAAPRTARKHSVLIVDEDEDLRALLSATLGSRGYHVRTAEDGMEALAAALSNPIHIVLLDALASGIEGESLITLLRQRQPTLPIIYLAGPIGESAVDEALRQGAALCLRKPFHMESLLKNMERLLQGASIAQAG